MDEYKQLIKEIGQTLLVFLAKETENDPIEKTVDLQYNNPIPVKGIIEDLAPNQVIWRIPGLQVTKAKMVVVHKRHLATILLSQKFQLKDEYETYYGFRQGAGKNMQIKTMGNYIQLYIYSL